MKMLIAVVRAIPSFSETTEGPVEDVRSAIGRADRPFQALQRDGDKALVIFWPR